jgi:hypothetical protein
MKLKIEAHEVTTEILSYYEMRGTGKYKTENRYQIVDATGKILQDGIHTLAEAKRIQKRLLHPLPRFTLGDIDAEIDENGELWLDVENRLSGREALEFGKWLVKTFKGRV